MTQGLFTPEEVSDMILAGDNLLLAGDAKLLSQLPAGNWIGGSTTFFILYPENKTTSNEKIFVNQLPRFVTDVDIKEYDETSVKTIFNNGRQNSFTVLIMPWFTPIAVEYSLNSPYYEKFALHPVCGWLAGLSLENQTDKSYVLSGWAPGVLSEKGIAMQVMLPKDKYVDINIFNAYKQGNGDSIVFDYSSLTLTYAIINGKKRNLAQYLREVEHKSLFPLVANYSGAMINITILNVGETEVTVSAPVFQGVDYRLAVANDEIAEPELISDKIILSVTCVGNYIQSDICRKYFNKMNGPAVFGEIAYQQLGMSTVYVTVDDILLNSDTK